MHLSCRIHTSHLHIVPQMCYPQGNSDHYAQFVSEPIEIYVERKRALTVHGNHLEIQVLMT